MPYADATPLPQPPLPEQPLTWDELDQLADWTAGLLTGPDADRIAHLVTTDPRWHHAHTTITTNQPTITTALHTTAPTPHEPIPPDIAHRITTTLTEHTHPARANPARANPARANPARAHRLRTNRTALSLAAAIVLTLCGVTGALQAGRLQTDEPSQAVAEAGVTAERMPTVETTATTPVVASGRDYTRTTLNQLAELAKTPPQAETLSAPVLDDRCVGFAQDRYPGTVLLVDLARYEGVPAVIVLLQVDDGTRLVVVMDALCGLVTTAALPAVVVD